jgi:hypothetical protein
MDSPLPLVTERCGTTGPAGNPPGH